MKKILLICLALIIPCALCLAEVNYFEGVEIDNTSTIEGTAGCSEVEGQTIVTACVPDTSTYVMNQTTESDGQGLSSDAYGQEISLTGEGDYDLSQIKLQFGATTTAGATATVRIGTSADLGTAMEEWSITLDGGSQLYTCTSIDNDTFTDGTTYYVGVIKTSGTISLRFDTGGDDYTGGHARSAGTVWAMGAQNTNRDYTMQVLKCQ